MNKNLIKGLVILAVVGSFALVPLQAEAKKNQNKKKQETCHFNRQTANSVLDVHQNSITAQFHVPKECKNERVSFVVYKIADGNYKNKIGNQHIFASRTIVSNGGNHNIRLNLPDCAWQADLVKGNPVRIALGKEQNPILRATIGRQGEPCKKPPVTLVTPTTPTTPVTPEPTVVTQTQTQSQEQTVVNRPAPAVRTAVKQADAVSTKELPNTGPGEVAAAVAAISMGSSIVYYMAIRRFDLIGILLNKF